MRAFLAPFLLACGGSGLGSGAGAGGPAAGDCSNAEEASNDADDDGVCDVDDVCDDGDDAADADDDAVPDACDDCPDDRFDDTDVDGVCDSDDVCPGFADGDLDGDGEMDGCDGHSLTVTLRLTTNPQNPSFTIVAADDDIDSVDQGEVLGSGGFTAPDQTLSEDVLVPVTRWICIELLNPAGAGGVNGNIVDNDRVDPTGGGPVVLIDFFDGSWSDDYFQCAEVVEDDT